MADERRRNKRVNAGSIIWYEIKDYERLQNREDNVDIGVPQASVDISVGGAQIITSKPMEQGKTIKVIVSPENAKLPIVILAKIIWSKKNGEQENYAIGMEFIEFLNNRKDVLEKFIEAH